MAHGNMGFVLLKQKRLDDSLKSYEMSYKMKPSAATKTAMDKVKGNIDVRENNKKMDAIAASNQQAKDDAEREYQEALDKAKQYDKEVEKD